MNRLTGEIEIAMEIVIGSFAAMLVIVIVIAIAGQRPKQDSTQPSGNGVSTCAANDEEVLLI